MRAPHILSTVLAASAVSLLAACTQMPMRSNYSQAMLPDAVKVPAGHRPAGEAVGTGQLTYECREKTAMPGTYEWVFVGPNAVLTNRAGTRVGTYYGLPATWESTDGSKISGTQLAISPGASGSIPLQLVKTDPAVGSGMMSGVTYIQRVNTQGGVAPTMPCDATNTGKRELVNYQADYIFYTAM